MSTEAMAAIRRKRDEYRTKWAALVEVLEDLGDPHPEGEPDATVVEAEEEEEELPPPRVERVRRAKPTANGEANGTHTPRVGPAESERRQVAIARYLVQHGPTGPTQLCGALGIPKGSIHHLLASDWFRKTDAGWEATQAGRDAAKGAD